jgi:hypothetical protein
MPRLLDELLHEHAVVAEAVLGLVAAGDKAFGAFLVVVRDTQALATATGTALSMTG